jgi:phage regulator Rha-like protein
MTRDGFTLLAMGFKGKKALGWKLKYIEGFNAMEATLRAQPAVDPMVALSDPATLRALLLAYPD